jgi:uncharacterized protein
MPRRPCCRSVAGRPAAAVFRPAGVRACEVREIVLTLDEFEAIRLADLEGLYQEQAAEAMRVSRSTFSRIVESARRKVADALVHGCVLRIEGGPVTLGVQRCCKRHDAAADELAVPPRRPQEIPITLDKETDR